MLALSARAGGVSRNRKLAQPARPAPDSRLRRYPERTAIGIDVGPPRSTLPTPVQFVLETHDTAVSKPNLEPVGLGRVWVVQVVPSQTSASSTGEPLAEPPTAMHSIADAHDTPLSVPPPVGSGML